MVKLIKSIAVMLLLANKVTSAEAGNIWKKKDEEGNKPRSLINEVYDKLPDFMKKKDDEKDPIKDNFSLEFQDLVEENDLNFDAYEVQTDDGYLLTAFRIRKHDLK